MKTPREQPLAYSYGRFSSPQQSEGDSQRRQDQAAAAWCKRNGVRLDSTTHLWDKGTSAFRGAHRQEPHKHALAAFLHMVEKGTVAPGSILIVENLDRLTRENPVDALGLLLDLLRKDVRIAVLTPHEVVYEHETGPMNLVLAVMEVGRSNQESVRKSDLLKASWAGKRARAREEGEVMTRRLPCWVEEKGGRLHLIPERVEILRLLYRLAVEGRGAHLIVKELVHRKVPVMGAAKEWNRRYVSILLNDRRLLGEFQPHDVAGNPIGEPIADYYPAAIGADLFDRARAAIRLRLHKRGRVGKQVNLFAGLMKNARDGKTYTAHRVRDWGGVSCVLQTEGGSSFATEFFPYDVFEKEILDQLAEVSPADVLGTQAPDELSVLLTRRDGILERIGQARDLLKAHPSRTLAETAVSLESDLAAINRDIGEARGRAASPTTEAWAETMPLLHLLDNASDPRGARLHFRGLLRRIIEEIRLMVTKRGNYRLAVAQLWFRDGVRSRTYLILHRKPWSNGRHKRPAESWSVSYPGPGEIDLRKPEDVALAEEFLLALDLK
jgi:DNA invertase Pin-like site-specific DNA recombinase